MKKNTIYYLMFSVAIFFSACDQSEITELNTYSDDELSVLSSVLDLPEKTYDYNVTLPPHFRMNGAATSVDINPSMATLGRVLFYDKKLSANNTVACASCHVQADAFSDKVSFSDGFTGQKTKRNSFGLGTVPNVVVYYGSGLSRFFWDHRAGSVEEQCQITIADPIEMGMDLNDLASKLEKEEYYRVLFKKAFQQEKIENSLIFAAISQFIGSFNSTHTRFDEALAVTLDPKLNFASFTAEENAGKAIFNNNCGSCHGKDHVFISTGVANNGLEINYTDKGIGGLQNSNTMESVFKVPLLRNVALTAPYMHDGRFATLREVIDHYSTGIVNHPNLHPDLKSDGNVKRMNFTEVEKQQLVAYLNTLTDNVFTQDIRFSNPFK